MIIPRGVQTAYIFREILGNIPEGILGMLRRFSGRILGGYFVDVYERFSEEISTRITELIYAEIAE